MTSKYRVIERLDKCNASMPTKYVLQEWRLFYSGYTNVATWGTSQWNYAQDNSGLVAKYPPQPKYEDTYYWADMHTYTNKKDALDAYHKLLDYADNTERVIIGG